MADPTPRAVPTRRIDFGFPGADLPRHFMDDNLLASHIVVVLSCMFPDGEDFFVRSVRNYRDRITDPELRRQVAGFIGQEAVHGREHRAFNDRLGELGYPTRYLQARVRILLGLVDRVLPKGHRLAITAALEHYTAALAQQLMEEPTETMRTSNAEIRQLFLWHALEESEHKTVAFDVFRTVSGSHRIRSGMMHITTFGFLLALVTGLVVSVATDPEARRPRQLRRDLRDLRTTHLASPELRRRIADYHRRDFHPDDHDTDALLEQWRTELFGDGGTLVARLRGTAAA